MAKVAGKNVYFPDPVGVVRDSGDAVVEFRQNGELVGEINFTKIIGQWLRAFGIGVKKPDLKSI